MVTQLMCRRMLRTPPSSLKCGCILKTNESDDSTDANNRLGESPSLFDIAWNLPASKEFHVLEDTATKLMNIRKNITGDDIASYLVNAFR